jgi:hypothetical protein
MPDAPDRLTPASPEDLADALAFALRFDGRKRKHDAGDFMARIVAERLVRHLDRTGFVVMKKPPAVGAAALAGFTVGASMPQQLCQLRRVATHRTKLIRQKSYLRQ